jgi:hypothetical protein
VLVHPYASDHWKTAFLAAGDTAVGGPYNQLSAATSNANSVGCPDNEQLTSPDAIVLPSTSDAKAALLHKQPVYNNGAKTSFADSSDTGSGFAFVDESNE